MGIEKAIELTEVAVQYRVPTERIDTLKEHVIRRLLRRSVEHRDIWALRGVSLEVNRGKALGIVGRNGAGKSTLLKVIAGILRPTCGRVWVRGKMSALIELGGGFHPELTGRENIYLKGALLGFSRSQMERKVNSIVDFSDLADFIDSPLRTYSSGMTARLGFAVATDVEPDVLIIDEILSVGDESFRRKSLKRMQQFLDNGTTILFVSHSMNAVESICTQAIWLDAGQIQMSGSVEEVIERYVAET